MPICQLRKLRNRRQKFYNNLPTKKAIKPVVNFNDNLPTKKAEKPAVNVL